MEEHKIIDSKFRLVILAAKRARQLLRGGRKKIEMSAENPLTIALEEINRGLINFEITDGTPKEPDLSIFGDSEETDEEAAVDLEETDLDVDDPEAEPAEVEEEAESEGEEAADVETDDSAKAAPKKKAEPQPAAE